MSRRLTTLLSASVLASALVLSACGEEAPSASSGALSAVTVEGTDPAKAPTVTVKAPLTVSKTASDVVKDGTGAAVGQDDLLSIQAVIVNGTDGKVAHSTWETGPVGLDLAATLPLVQEPAARQEGRRPRGHHLDRRRRVRRHRATTASA